MPLLLTFNIDMNYKTMIEHERLMQLHLFLIVWLLAVSKLVQTARVGRKTPNKQTKLITYSLAMILSIWTWLRNMSRSTNPPGSTNLLKANLKRETFTVLQSYIYLFACSFTVSLCLSVFLYVCLSVFLSVCTSVFLFTF